MGDIVSIEIKAWWLLIVPFLFMFSLFVVALIMKSTPNVKEEIKKNGEEEKKNKKDKTLTSWVKRKDILYWLLIMCLGAISIFTYQYSGNKNVISHWGFAGTIVSIILAVIAIGFTLFQTLSSDLSSAKIADSAKKIQDATNNLDSQTLLESSKIMKEAAEYLKIKMHSIDVRLQDIDNGQKIIHSMANGFRENDNGNDNQKKPPTNHINLNNFVEEIFPKLPFYPKLFIYINFKMIESGKKFTRQIDEEFVKLLSDVRINKVNNQNSSKEDENYTFGANTGSQGATYSFINNLGVTNQFKKLNLANKNIILEKCKSNMHSRSAEYITLIDEYVKNM
ncbi:hypothetical protein VO178_09570 [Lysinibacillus fusiformis]|uniref:hypothetical protein n=1 Tax=Lysinibacillus fusiformis TaxID=28031 RepID=UPI002D786AB8|nr:hypothetical protein [Lysinibacillus fusiformis]WRS99923.1 hypothetical protein VO178_09570 [Lysinibacillus fusiformis]